MATTTTNLSLTKPAVNSAVDEDLWGTQINADLDTVDSEHATKTINLDFNDKVLSKAEMKDIGETAYSVGNITGAAAIDYTNGNYQYATLTGNVTGLTISNPPASGIVGFLTLELIQDGTGSRTIDLTGGTYRQAGGGSLTLSTGAGDIDKLRLETRDAGTTWDVAISSNYGAIT